MTHGAAFDQPARYQIRVGGTLDQEGAAWFEEFEIVPQGNEETILSGQIDDQAALHGLLVRIYTLGLPLISVSRETEGET